MKSGDFNKEIVLSWNWEDEDGNHDDGEETLIVNDYTEEDIKSCVDDYLNSKEFRYSNCDPRLGEFVHFFVEVQMIPGTMQRETLFSGTFLDGYIDWEEENMDMNEGTETNPRFKCMEDGLEDESTEFLLELVDEEGNYDEIMVDLTDESDWGNINTADGSCYFHSGEEFDGIGWGNDEDGYLRICAVWRNRYQDNEEEISTREFAEIVDSLAGLYSDM